MRRILERTKLVLAVAVIAGSIVLISTGDIEGTDAAPSDVKATYKSKCASCHGVDGSGKTAKGKSMKLRDLRSVEVQGLSDAQLYEVTAKGKGKMPGYEKSLGVDTCKALAAHIRTLAGK